MEHELSPSGLIRLTKSVVDWVYGGIPAPVLQYLHYDIVWINDRYDQYLYGYSAVCRGLMAGFCPEAGEMIHHHYHVQTLKRDIAVVTGQFRAAGPEAGSQGSSASSHCTFIWSWSREEAKLLHVHISQVQPQESAGRQLLLRGGDGSIYYLSPNEILYVEARNIYCNVHCTSQMISVSQSMKQVGAILPDQFLKIHRSFIVNSRYVSRVYRYGLELVGGICLPVPEKQYMNVVCSLKCTVKSSI